MKLDQYELMFFGQTDNFMITVLRKLRCNIINVFTQLHDSVFEAHPVEFLGGVNETVKSIFITT